MQIAPLAPRGDLRSRELSKGLFDRTPGFGRIQIRNPQITHRRLDVFVTKEVLDGLNLRRA